MQLITGVVVVFLVLTVVNISHQSNELAGLMFQTVFGTEEELKAKCMVSPEENFESLFSYQDADENKRCFVKCVFVTYGIMNENGDLLVENFKKTVDIPDELLTSIKQHCGVFNKDDLCSGSQEFIGCAVKFAEEVMGM